MRRILFFLCILVSIPFLGFADEPVGKAFPCDCGCDWDANQCCFEYNRCPVWLPQGPPLFRQFIADPRQLTFSMGWRFEDNLFDQHVGAVSFGDTLGLFRYYNPLGRCGVFEVTLDGGLWAIFKHVRTSGPLVNADYYGGLSFNYAWQCLAFRFRLYHISSHIGDEFLIEHPSFDRRNASSEFADFYVSYEKCRALRVYFGGGAIFRSDEEFKRKEPFVGYGAEWILPWCTYHHCKSRMNIEPFVALHMQHAADTHWDFDGTLAAGWQFIKLCGCEKTVRIFAEYHHGFSVEGQFARERTNYCAIRMTYGY